MRIFTVPLWIGVILSSSLMGGVVTSLLLRTGGSPPGSNYSNLMMILGLFLGALFPTYVWLRIKLVKRGKEDVLKSETKD